MSFRRTPRRMSSLRTSSAEERQRSDMELLKAQIHEPLPAGSTWHELGGTDLEPHLTHTTLIDAAWLLKFALGEVMPERRGIVPAWQHLPRDATADLPVCQSDLLEALKRIHSSVSAGDLTRHEQWLSEFGAI